MGMLAVQSPARDQYQMLVFIIIKKIVQHFGEHLMMCFVFFFGGGGAGRSCMCVQITQTMRKMRFKISFKQAIHEKNNSHT